MKKCAALVLFVSIFGCEGSFQGVIKNDANYQQAKWKFALHKIEDLQPIDYKISNMPKEWQHLQKESEDTSSGRDALTCLVANFLDEKEIVYWMHAFSILFPKTDTSYLCLHPFSEEVFFSHAPTLSAEKGVTLEGADYGVKITQGTSVLHLLFTRYLSAGLDQLHLLHVSGHGQHQGTIRRPFGVTSTAPLFYYESEVFPRSKHKLNQCEVFFPRSYKEVLKWTQDSYGLDSELLGAHQKVTHKKEGFSYLYKRTTEREASGP
jgi:hypothetical protein